MIDKPVVIILDKPNAAEREAVHALVKENSSTWWHHFTDVWITGGGKSVAEWRTIVGDALEAASPSSVLVVALPKTDRAWAYKGKELRKRTGWLHKTLSGKVAPWELEK